VLFIFSGQKDVAQIVFTLRCVKYMVTSVLQDQQYRFGVRSLLMDEEVLLMKKDLANVLFQRLSAVASIIRSDRRLSISVQIKLDDILKN